MTQQWVDDGRGNKSAFEVMGLVPATSGPPHLAASWSRAGGVGVLDLEFCGLDEDAIRLVFERLLKSTETRVGLRLTAAHLPLVLSLASRAPSRRIVLVLAGSPDSIREMAATLRPLPQIELLAEVPDAADASELETVCDGVILRGQEAGGWVGPDSSFILLQKIHGKLRKPFLVQGGIGVRSAAACLAAGAAGVVLDDALLLLDESPLPATLKTELGRLNGSECRSFGEGRAFAFRGYARPSQAVLRQVEDLMRQTEADTLSSTEWRDRMSSLIAWNAESLLPLGQAAGLAKAHAERYTTATRLVQAVRRQSMRQNERAAELGFLDENGPLAASHGTRWPVAQGPMTRVSDSAAFAASVARAGGLPFLALALMRGPEVGQLLAQATARLDDAPWGVGLLGFVPQALRDEQCEAIWKAKPAFALIAGGRPDQAEEFEKRGIATYLHAPAPALLRLFLEQGARRFVFEGRECGGHVGPLASFPLWEQMIETLLAHVPAGEEKKIHVLFAGGIHDALSGAMVAALSAPLADKGMKVGVLMGTAYLFTHEIVSSGAVVSGFQKAALECERTVNLESGPGHATRCVDSPFTADFQALRRKLIREGRNVEEVRDALEDLNLGRLRLASKGFERSSAGKLVEVDAARQQRDGMFMIGQVATLRDRVLPIESLHENVCRGAQEHLLDARDAREASVQEARPSDVAIVGIGVTLPKANSAGDYWQMILDRTSVIREAPKDRWDSELFYDPDQKARDKIYSKWGGFLDEVAFDPMRFGIPPRSMKSIDPFQLLALETAARTLADAGYADGQFDRENTSVILGAGGGAGDLGAQYALRAELPRFVENPSPEVWDRLPEWTEESFAGTLLNVAAGRIANRLDFGGLNFTIDAACGSSLAAISLAVAELESGRSSMVLAGGFDTTQSAYAFTAFAKTQALSPTGKSRTFDQAADGITISEGVAMVALKRLADAERDGDRIYAVIKATAGSSDGRALGLTAPRTEGQVRALRRAYRKAGFSPATLGLVEAHGTGTPVGDRTEAQTVAQALVESGTPPRSVALGSVKTLLGHTKAAAGAAGLIKVALALHHRVLPAHHGVDKPIDTLADKKAPVYLLKDPQPWLADADHPRRGAASAFGFGGTNFHAVLEEYRGSSGASCGSARWPAELLLFRAPDVAALVAQVQKLSPLVQEGSRLRLAELAATLAAKAADAGAGQPVALAIVATDLRGLATDLAAVEAHLQGGTRPLPPHIRLARAVPETEPAMAFLFPGQGAQYLGMGREASLYFPEMRAAFELADRTLANTIPERLSRYVLPFTAFDAQVEADQLAALTDTRIAQPAIGTLALGYLELARTLGLKASACAGHSYGEYAALMAAGVMTPVDFLKLSAVRGSAMADASRSAPPGGMAAVQAGRERVQALIGGFEGVRVANHNMPEQSVISGPREALDRAVKKLDAEGLRATVLPVSGAFHTALVAPARAPLTAAIHATPFSPAALTVYSNSTGAPYPREPEAMQRQLDEHLLSSVEFVTEIEAMYAAGCRVFVELGPKGICSGMARQTLAGRDVVATSLDGSGGGLRGLLIGLAELFTAGVRIDVQALFRHRDVRGLDPDRLEEASRPLDLPKHTWMISGGCARPIDDPVHRTGAKPALSRQDAESARAAIERRMESEIEARLAPQIASRPVAAQPGAPQIVSPAITSEALLAYQQTMQQFLALQERVVSQFLNGAAPATAEVRLAAPATLAHPAAPATVATGVSQAPVTPVAATPPVAPAAPIAVFDPRTLLVAIVSERTGYPQEMLDLDADLEADLGIDSIKRVEILGALRKGLPETMASAAQGRMEKLTRTRSLRAILAELATFAPAPGPAVEPAAAPALAPAAVAEIAFDLRAALLSVVAERTGYPAEMLGMDADLEADLGIDSIKRVEILGAFRKQLPEALSASLAGGMEKLTRARSLGAILGLLPSTVESATVGAPPSAPAAMAAPVPAAAVAVDTAPIRELLLRVVAERTGYPAEMLGMDADLEADLGIDSIKRVEILGALKSQVDATNAAAMSARMEKLTRARSLSKILAELAEAPAAPAPAPAMTVGEPAANDAASTIAEDALPRYVVKSTRLQTPEPAASGFAGPVLVLGPADALITRVMRELGLRKLNAVHVTETDGSALREAIDAMRKQHGAVRGLLHLHGMMPAPAATLVQWRSLYQRDLTSLLHAVQATLDDVPQMRLIAASRLGGTFGRDAVGDGGPVAGGANGLLNCLRAEFPSVRARAVDFDGQSDAEIATLLLDELLAESSEPEAGYIGIERFGSCTIEEPLVPNPFPEPVEPAADWVLLATGGARGITAEIIEELCVPGMRLVLLGRTPEPAAEDLALSARGSEDEVRKYLLAASLARGEKPRPVEIDRAVARVMTDREVRANLRRLRATGATVDYVPCDVRDDAAFGSLIDRLYERFGRIDAVIHGAGVIEDKRLGDKSVESFERVLGTKLDPAFVLASRLRPASLKLLAFFTSVAGRFGNLGQGDYAAANEALNRLAWDLHRRWTHTRVISINWGPWDAGMASEGVKRGLRERGMEPIPVKAGRRFFREELAHGPKHEVELVAGRGPWGRRANETAPAPWTLDDVGMDAGGVLVGRMQLRADGVADDSQTLVAAMKRLVAIGWRGWTVSDIRELRMPAQPLASGQLRARAASHSEPEEQAVTVELTGPGSREVLARATVILRQGHASAIAAPGGP